MGEILGALEGAWGAVLRARASSLSAPSNMPATDAFTRGPLLPAAARFVTNSTPVAARATAAFDKAWHKLLGAYLSRTPSAVRAVDILDQRGGRVHNDHIALRSFVDSSGRSGLAFLDFAFTSFGYKPEDDITIPNLPCRPLVRAARIDRLAEDLCPSFAAPSCRPLRPRSSSNTSTAT